MIRQDFRNPAEVWKDSAKYEPTCGIFNGMHKIYHSSLMLPASVIFPKYFQKGNPVLNFEGLVISRQLILYTFSSIYICSLNNKQMQYLIKQSVTININIYCYFINIVIYLTNNLLIL